jgi:hypothetical protein
LVDDLICHRLRDMFKAVRKTVYDEVLPLPRLKEVADRVRKGRVLLIVSPDSKIPPEEVQIFFDGLSQKNNLCVLTGDKTAMGNVEKAARQLFATQKADGRIPQAIRSARTWNGRSRPTSTTSRLPSSACSTRCSSPFSALAGRPSLRVRRWI